MAGVGIILNSNSNIFRKDPSRVEGFFRLAGDRATLKVTENPSQTMEVAKEFLEKEIDLLAIIGGDGTLRMTLGKFIEIYGDREFPAVAIIPAGTMNTTAASIGVSGRSEKLLQKVLRKYEDGETFIAAPRHILKVNDEYGFIFGNGFFYNFIELYKQRAYPSVPKGFMLLARAAVSTILGLSLSRRIFGAFPARLKIDGHEIAKNNYSAIACSTINYIGYGFNPFCKALERTNAFHMLGFPADNRGIVCNLHRFYFGKEPGKEIFQAVAGRLTIETDFPVGYQLDGETMLAGKTVEIQISRKFGFLSGKNF